MAYPIKKMEGGGPVFAEQLTGALPAQVATASGRKQLSAASGNHCRTTIEVGEPCGRIPGRGPSFSELLQGSGVDTVKELRNVNADNLAPTMPRIIQRK